MNISKREKIIAILALIIVGLLAADRIVITPLFEYRQMLIAERDRLTDDLQQAQKIFRKSKLMRKQWNAMRTHGLATDPSATESSALHAVRQWSQDANLDLVALKPEILREQTTLSQIEIQVTANGSMHQVARFLYMVETSDLPIRIVDIQLGSRQNASDDLSLQARLSVLFIGDVADSQLAWRDSS